MHRSNRIELAKLICSFRHLKNPDWNRLFTAVYDNLRDIAFRVAGYPQGDPSCGGTSIVHDAYIKFATTDSEIRIQSVSHFFSLMGKAMRQVIADHYKSKNRFKNGGNVAFVELDIVASLLRKDVPDYSDLYEAIESLEQFKPRCAEILQMQCFLAMTVNEIMAATNLSKSGVEKDLREAKSFVKKFIANDTTVSNEAFAASP